MNRSMIWLVLLSAGAASGCREVCSSDEVRYGDRCVLRPDSGINGDDAEPEAGLDGGAPDAGEEGGGPTCLETQEYWRDLDGDGYGGTEESVHACSAPSGYVERGGDCDDANKQVHEGAPELCNGLDDDCEEATLDGADQCDGFRCGDDLKCLKTCSKVADCLPGLSCEADACVGSRAAGERCLADAYCASRSCACADSRCMERRCAVQTCLACRFVDESGTACDGALDGVSQPGCPAPLLCVAGACKGGEDAACSADEACASGSCDQGNMRCQPAQGIGGACDSPPDCAPGGVCNGGRCKLENGVACGDDAQCVSQSCFRTCQAPAPFSGGCDSAQDCQASLSCSAGACKRTVGQACGADTECASGRCGPSGQCIPYGAPCPSGSCAHASLACTGGASPVCKFADAQPCADDGECVQGSCFGSGAARRCRAPTGFMTACDSNADCRCGSSAECPGCGTLSCARSLCLRGHGCQCTSNEDCAQNYCETQSPPAFCEVP